MPKIALDGAEFNESTASGHINTERYIQTGTGGGFCNAWNAQGQCIGYAPTYPIMEWVGGYSVSAKINGKAKASQNQVFINNKNVILKDDRTDESDTYTVGANERYASGQHTSAQGSVTGGNSNNVYIGGKLACVESATVKTHANTNTALKNGYSTNVHIGG